MTPEPTATSTPTAMWEAKAADGRLDDLVAFATTHAHADAQIYRSADGRVVVIDPSGAGLPTAPDDLLSRDPHVWRFRRVER